MKTKTELRTERLKRNIIKAATELFIKNGYTKTSISAIVAKAGVSRVTLFKYIESKDELARLVSEHYINETFAEYRALLANPTITFPAMMQTFLRRSLENVHALHPDFFAWILAEYAGEQGSTRLGELYVAQSGQFLTDFLNYGRQTRYLSDKISNESLLLYIDMFIKYFQVTNDAQQAQFVDNVEQYTEELTALFYHGLLQGPRARW